jgi:uncharacterized protein YbjT (DUF2867 family)
MPALVHVIGASGRSGAALCRALAANGVAFVPVVRDAGRWAATGLGSEARLADLADPPALRAALADATHVVSTAHARCAAAVLEAAPAGVRFVFLGSTRKFTAWPDDHGNGVLAGERAFLASNRPGVMLHPTMIYGAQGEDNVQRLAALLRRLPVVPLPGGGGALVQPIHQADVTACILAALRVHWDGPESLVIAGPEAVVYAAFVRAVAAAAGQSAPTIIPIPEILLRLIAPLTSVIPLLPTIHANEIRRLTEDKAFSIELMTTILGVLPVKLEDGLSQMFLVKSNHQAGLGG